MLTILPFTFNYHIREIPDHTLEHIYKFIASLIESEQPKEKRACRGPFLAQLELGKLCKQQCIYSDSRLSKLLQYIMYLHYVMYLINVVNYKECVKRKLQSISVFCQWTPWRPLVIALISKSP